MNRVLKKLKEYFPQSVRSWIVFFITMGCASAICIFLQKFTVSEEYRSDVHVPMIFVLAVLIISFFTDGYFYGFLAAVTSVFAVNWAFTYPYMKLDFSIYGYPLTFLTMLAVGFAASTLASGLKERDKLRIETEREKTRANLLRSVSHDLRTPLTAISGSVAAILDDDGTLSEDAKRELLQNAKQDADWLYRMVENLLSITRMSSGSDSTKIIKTYELPEEVFSEAIIKFKNRNPDVTVNISLPEEAVFIPMDAMLIEQVLINLMDNSVIHGKTTDRINIEVTDQKRCISVSVKDNGCGIDEKLIQHIFDGSFHFREKEKSGGDSNRFMGIGLAVCKTIVEAHGGEISARNSLDSGAEFVFTLLKGEDNEYSG